MNDTRRDAATVGTGAGLVTAGAVARHASINQAERIKQEKPKRLRPRSVVLRHGGLGRQRTLWLAGAAAGFSGATGLGVGASNLVQDYKAHRERAKRIDPFKKADNKPLWQQGFEGTADATKERVRNAAQPKSSKAVATQLGAGTAAGLLGSLGAHRGLDHLGRHRYPSLLSHGGRVRPVVTALAGSGAGLASIPATNRLMHRVAPGYESVPGGGVRRKKTANVRPSRKANIVNSNALGARQQIVPSDRFGKAVLTDTQRRLAVQGAASTPVVGGVAGPAMAARLAPPGEKTRSAALYAGGTYGGTAVGAAGGAYGAAHLASKYPGFKAGSQAAQSKINSGRSKVADKLPARAGNFVKPHTGELTDRMTRMAGHANPVVRQAGRAMLHASGPLKEAGAAAVLGGYAGSKFGATTGGQAAYTHALRNQHKRSEALSKGRRFAKAMAQPLTSREQAQQYKRKRRALALTAAGTAIGTAGTGAYAAGLLAAKRPHLAHLAPKLERAGIHTAIAGGTIGALAGMNSFGVQRRALRDERARLQRKAIPVTSSKAFRRSALRMVPTNTAGVTRPVRVRNAVTKSQFPGGEYRKITEVGRATRAAQRARLQGTKTTRQFGQHQQQPLTARGTNPRDNELNNALHQLRQIPARSSGRRNVSFGESVRTDQEQDILAGLPRKVKRPVTVHTNPIVESSFGTRHPNPHTPQMTGGVRGLTTGRAGQQRPSHMTLDWELHPFVTAHEFTHSQGRRNAGRLMNIIQDPGKLGREEARADVGGMRAFPKNHLETGYEVAGSVSRAAHRGSPLPKQTYRTMDEPTRQFADAYARQRGELGHPVPKPHKLQSIPQPARGQFWVSDQLARDNLPRTAAIGAGGAGAYGYARHKANAKINSDGEPSFVGKIDTTMKEHEAKPYVSQYGLKGPLPKGLDRTEKMRAYEARYVASGGPKGEKHQQRADRADRVTGGALGIGGASAFGTIAGRHPRVKTRLPRLHSRSDVAGLGAAGVGALSELYHRHEEHRARSYRSSPGGVAASALRRMRDYTPD